MRVVILHGLDGSGADHWQTWLASELAQRGDDVAYPSLPEARAPSLERWLAALAGLRPGEGDVVVCHSLACCLWLHHRARGGRTAARALLVAPPCRDDIPEIAGFFPVPLRPELATEARLVCSDDDPYCPAGAAGVFGEPLGCPVDLLPGAGHINPDSGYGPWPSLLDRIYGVLKKVDER